MTANLVSVADPSSPAAEAYRRLRLNLSTILSAGTGLSGTMGEQPRTPRAEFERSAQSQRPRGDTQEGGQPLRTLLVVAASHIASAEKAKVVANLAVTFARVGKQVILVDGDLRLPAQHTLFGLNNQTGMTDLLRSIQEEAAKGLGPARLLHGQPVLGAAPSELPSPSAAPLQQAAEVAGLRILTSGPTVPVPSEWIAGLSMEILLERLKADAELVIFDAPPVLVATDAAELARLVDGVLLTIHAGRTRREDAARAVDQLTGVGARILGAALIDVPYA